MKIKAIVPMIPTIGSALKECVIKLMLNLNRVKNYSSKTYLANLAATLVAGDQ